MIDKAIFCSIFFLLLMSRWCPRPIRFSYGFPPKGAFWSCFLGFFYDPSIFRDSYVRKALFVALENTSKYVSCLRCVCFAPHLNLDIHLFPTFAFSKLICLIIKRYSVVRRCYFASIRLLPFSRPLRNELANTTVPHRSISPTSWIFLTVFSFFYVLFAKIL